MPGGLGGTYSGNPLACEAAIATWEAMTAQQLPARSARIGRLFEEITRDWSERFPLIGDRRGLGAMRAFELVRDRATKAPAREETARILQHCHDRGLIVISAGTYGNVLRLHLPLVASDEQLREGMAILESAFAATP
jgi:4-aminobutyrate aminotransferase/(S)-3-amino-2-methylpropionate transaminase